MIKSMLKDAADAYRCYWHRENAKYRAMIKGQQNVEQVVCASGYYCNLTPLMAETMDNVSDKLHFSAVKRASQLHCRKWLHIYPCGVWVLRYRCRYQPGYGIDRKEFRRTLQNELFQVCDFWLVPHLAVDVELAPGGIAYIEIVPYDTFLYWYNRRYRRKI